jgi:hypothetical protein
MENTTIKFQEYLDHRMSPEEETAFKAELESDAKLKSKFVAFMLKRLQVPDQVDPETREMVSEVYRNMTPVKMTNPSRIYRLNRFASDNWPKLATAASFLLVMGYLISVYTSEAYNTGKNLNEIMVEPISMERASSSEMKQYEKASYFYFKPSPLLDSLEAMSKACSDFCLPKYYLAHAYLKNKQYDKANLLFEDCLKNIDFLTQIPQLQGHEQEIRLNVLISRAGLKMNSTEILKDLDKLIDELKPNEDIYQSAESLRKVLKK